MRNLSWQTFETESHADPLSMGDLHKWHFSLPNQVYCEWDALSFSACAKLFLGACEVSAALFLQSPVGEHR